MAAQRRTHRRTGNDTDRGSTTVEMAVLLPLMLLLLMVVVQVGIWFHTRAVMVTAANKGVDAARVDDGTAADGERVTEDFLRHAGALRSDTVDVERSPATASLRSDTVDVERSPATASVTVSGRVVSLLFGVPLDITVTAEAPVEELTP